MAWISNFVPRLLAAWSVLILFSTLAAAQCPGVSKQSNQKMASGYTSSVLATGLRTPRGIAMDTEGALLVAEQQGGAVRRLTLKDVGNNVCVDTNTVLIPSGNTNHGVAVSADGKTIFVSNLQKVTAFPYDPVAGTVGTAKTIITNMQNNGPHPTRALLTSKFSPDSLLVTIGSNANVDTATTAQSAGRCMIKKFSISQIMANPTTYTAGGEVLGWGLRNLVGMGEHPIDGGIWSVENGMDDIRLNSKDVHNENPAERALYHGRLNDTANKLKGANYGYPSCVAAWDTGLLGVSSLSVGSLFAPDNVPKATDCASRQPGRIHFPSHTAPLDIKWTADGMTAYVAFHGSWDRRPADGYRVMKIPFGADGQPVAPLTSRSAATTIMENANTGSCPTGCFRPVGLAFDKKGRLFVSSDSTGEIHVIYGA
ncbi:soluble quino protein glucose/sorbosone dehydrogenase [Cercophora newfieldiana]|uniref:Soluble quino protein glucose/sorbosone dehydrogenase n=1 Tax=Cercophora newfieldiana TaxID=92897 RepID=A0AA39Y1C7_9PEZI|nr:soluble quino protein glucose/sorbosone dehydrogenase [Cercophora newfieldiana]